MMRTDIGYTLYSIASRKDWFHSEQVCVYIAFGIGIIKGRLYLYRLTCLYDLHWYQANL